MNEPARAKGLAELRTATTHHIASKPPRKGTNYLDIFVLSMERQRLEQELAGIERRRKRILNHLADVQTAMEKLMNVAQPGNTGENHPSASAVSPESAAGQKQEGQQWKKMAIGY